LNTTTTCCLIELKKPGYLVRNLPPLGIHDVHVRTLAGAISIGAELPQWLEQDMTETDYVYPLETGYESYGKVLAVGEAVQTVKPGDRVVGFYGHQDQAVVPESKVILVPAHVSPREALLLILSCDAAKGVRKLTLTPDTSVLVSGMGKIGLLTVHYLRHYVNVRQIDIIEPLASRAELARQLGAHIVTPDSDTYDRRHRMFRTSSGLCRASVCCPSSWCNLRLIGRQPGSLDVDARISRERISDRCIE